MCSHLGIYLGCHLYVFSPEYIHMHVFSPGYIPGMSHVCVLTLVTCHLGNLHVFSHVYIHGMSHVCVLTGILEMSPVCVLTWIYSPACVLTWLYTWDITCMCSHLNIFTCCVLTWVYARDVFSLGLRHYCVIVLCCCNRDFILFEVWK